MSQDLDLNINVNTEGASGKVKSFREQLREASKDVITLSEKFGATSNEAVTAAKKVAELRDKIGDAKSLVDAFNPDAKFKALTSSLAGVAGGFGAVQGAMALFGAESDNVQKTLLKVQSAMALSQGLQAVGESIDSFKQLGAVIRTQVVSAFSTLKGAIISTGIGALAVGLGLLITNFEQVKQTLLNLFPGLAEFGDKVKGIVQAITDWAGITSQANRDTEDLTKGMNAYIKSIDRSIKELEAQGGREEEVYKLKKDRIKKQLLLIKGANDEELQKIADLNTEKKILEIQEQKRLDKKAEEDKKKADKIAEETRAFNLRAKLQVQADDLALAEDGKKLQAEADKADAEAAKAAEEDRIKGLQYRTAQVIQINKAAQDRDKADKDALKQAELEFQNSKFEIANQGLNLIQQLAGQGTAVAKAAALSQIIIDTGRGFASGLTIAQSSAKGTGPAAAFAFPIFYATQIAAVLGAVGKAKSILSQVPGGGGVGGSVSAPTLATQAPIAPQAPQAATTNISQESINDLGNKAIKAYVVESDITSSQKRVSTIQNQSSFS